LTRKVTNPLSLLQDICSLADFLILLLVALAVHLEAAEKVLSEERASRLATNQYLAEEKAARQLADRSAWSYQKANALGFCLLCVTLWLGPLQSGQL
jgi:hypothetical protein